MYETSNTAELTRKINIQQGKTSQTPKVLKETLFSIDTRPINSITSAIKNGGYSFVTHCIEHDHNKSFSKLSPDAQGTKRIYFLPVSEKVFIGQEDHYAKKFGFKICEYARNYLLGLIADTPKDRMPPELKGKMLVAAENQIYQYGTFTSSIFSVRCHENGDRELIGWICPASFRWNSKDDEPKMFLVEKIA